MSCRCPDLSYVLSEVPGEEICTKTTVIPNIECPPGCTLIIQQDGNAICECNLTVDPTLEDVQTVVQLENTEYFEEVSFTVAYSLNTQSWISYYDFKPNYYINHNNYFQTGLNNPSDNNEFGLWSHLITRQSFGVFYGKKYEIGLEYPIETSRASKTLETIEVWANGFHYKNKFDQIYNRDVFFNKLRIYNDREASGDLNLVPQKGLKDTRKYPKLEGNTQSILATNSKDRWYINYFYNRVTSEHYNQPIILWDVNQINKEFNNKVVKFRGKRVLEPLRGDYFLVYLGYDKDSRYAMEFKWATNKEDLE